MPKKKKVIKPERKKKGEKILTIQTASLKDSNDADQMVAMHNAIVENLNEKYLHGLRIDDKQLEAIYSDVMKDIEAVKKAA